MGLLDAFRESSALGSVLAAPPSERPVLFYAEDDFTHVQFEGAVDELLDRKIPVTYVTSSKTDPVLSVRREGFRALHIERQLPNLMQRISDSVLVMTMPDLGQFHVPKPEGCKVLYMFHSLNSLHTSYRAGAFDYYDHFACTGPHHVRELRALSELRGKPEGDLHEVGYYKLDRIVRDHLQFKKGDGRAPQALLAPTWSPENLLEAHGKELIRLLLGEGFRVVVRPHPQFFHSLYPKGRDVIDEILMEYKAVDGVEFEFSIRSEDSFHESDLMISDWSGAANEYALGTCRPVLFIDTPQKVFNPEWDQIGLPAFEKVMRDEVGAVVGTDRLSSVGKVASSLVGNSEDYASRLADLRDEVVYASGLAARKAADLIEELIG